MTREQLEKNLTGEIKNWKEVGGADEKIVAYSRESSSGTYEFFKDEVMDKKNYATNVLSLPATGAIVQAVGQDKRRCRDIGLAYETKEVKQLAVSYDQERHLLSHQLFLLRISRTQFQDPCSICMTRLMRPSESDY